MKNRVMITAALSVVLLAGQVMAAKKITGSHILVKDVVNRCVGDRCHVIVGASPSPGLKHTVSREDVVTALDAQGFDTSGLRLPKRQVVARAYRIAREAELAPRVRKATMAVLPKTVELDSLGRMTSVKVPLGAFDVSAVVDHDSLISGNVSVEIRLSADDVVFHSRRVFCRVKYLVDVPVATRDLGRDTVIMSSDVEAKTIRLSRLPRSGFLFVDDVIGMKTQSLIRRGGQIDERRIALVQIVQKGDAITVVSKSGGVRISARGFARQSGGRGEIVRVEVPHLNRVLAARIIESGFGEVVQ